jgi:hypothetical protein
MLALLHLIGIFGANLFKPRRQLKIENLFLGHLLAIALRRVPHRPRLHGSDHALMAWLTWFWPCLLDLSRVVQPDTILWRHRAGFRPTGAGNLAAGQDGQEPAVICANSFDR